MNAIYGTDETYTMVSETYTFTKGTDASREYEIGVDYDATAQANSDSLADLVAAYNDALAAYNTAATNVGGATLTTTDNSTLTSYSQDELDTLKTTMTQSMTDYNAIQKEVASYSEDEDNQATLITQIQAGKAINKTTSVEEYLPNAGIVVIHFAAVAADAEYGLAGTVGIDAFNDEEQLEDEYGVLADDARSVPFTIAADDMSDRVIVYDGTNC